MSIGDKVYIWDPHSDLFIKKGEVVQIKGRNALVMITIGRAVSKGCIVDWFEIDKLYVCNKNKKLA